MSNIVDSGLIGRIMGNTISYFTNRSGLSLAYSILIKNPKLKKIWIICENWPSQLFIINQFLHENLSANTFKFDYTGCENSQGEHSFGGLTRDANDIDDAVNFLNSKGYEVEGIIGHSKAAQGVIIYSAIYGQVKNIIVLSARFHMNVLPFFLHETTEIARREKEIIHTGVGSRWKFTWDMVEETINTDMKFYCERAQGDFYIFHGNEDEMCPFADSLEYVKALNVKCKGYFTFNCDHLYIGVFDEIIEIIEDIISKN
ncbi:unnamed protein product [Blepharisma stoltei]|uniref:Uncharacterized protein n=1 Tax=Blepharisma stoltei TaxID=1481888 RepID=A0AAU9K000_9CILI|nr:unnamed protein product [Blepharisma stoltei]